MAPGVCRHHGSSSFFCGAPTTLQGLYIVAVSNVEGIRRVGGARRPRLLSCRCAVPPSRPPNTDFGSVRSLRVGGQRILLGENEERPLRSGITRPRPSSSPCPAPASLPPGSYVSACVARDSSAGLANTPASPTCPPATACEPLPPPSMTPPYQ